MDIGMWQTVAGALGALLAALAVLMLRWMARQEESILHITHKLDALAVHPQACVSRFADRQENAASHDRLWLKTAEQDRILAEHETRIKVLEETR